MKLITILLIEVYRDCASILYKKTVYTNKIVNTSFYKSQDFWTFGKHCTRYTGNKKILCNDKYIARIKNK